MLTYGCNISMLSPQSLRDMSSDPNPNPPVHNCDPLLPSKPLVALRGSQALAGWCLRQRFPWTVGPWGYPNSNNSDSLEWKTLSNWIIWWYPYFRKHPFGPSKADSNGLRVFARQTQAWPSLNSADSRDRPHDTVLEKNGVRFPFTDQHRRCQLLSIHGQHGLFCLQLQAPQGPPLFWFLDYSPWIGTARVSGGAEMKPLAAERPANLRNCYELN